VANQFRAAGKAALMTVFRNDGHWDRSNVEMCDGVIRAYDKSNLTPGMRHIDYGLGVFRASALERVPLETSFDLAHLYQDLLAAGELSAFEVQERFYEIGSFEGLKELTTLLAARREP
jgi:NDP-sugar pyrophosphorylase family protein